MNYTLITGASKGIGKAFAEEFAKSGKNLILTARDEAQLKTLAEELSAQYKVTVHTYAADLLKDDAVENLYEWCWANKYVVDTLVNNAGNGLFGKFSENALEDYLDMIRLNQSALVAMCYTFLPMLEEVHQGHILNVSSVAAYQPTPYLSVYGATKSFVLMFSKALRQEVIDSGVNVSCVCPGPTDTDFFLNAGFDKKAEDLRNMQMSPQRVAEITVEALFRNQAVIVPGFTNRIGTVLSKLLPSGLMSELIGFVLKPKKVFNKS